MSARLARPSVVKAMLAELGLRPSRALGQNFLVDANILSILLANANLSERDTVLEVGPGLGVLTQALLDAGARVIAIEKDERLVQHLRLHFANHPLLDLRHADILDLDLPALLDCGITRIVANLPYSVGTRFLVEVFLSDPLPARIVVTLQKEVADRLRAAPGVAEYGLLSVIAQSVYAIRTAKVIAPTCFHPPPDVRSAIVALELRPPPIPDRPTRNRLRKLLHACFSQRRKKLSTILARHPDLLPPATPLERILAERRLSGDARPETLSVADWLSLVDFTGPPRDGPA